MKSSSIILIILLIIIIIGGVWYFSSNKSTSTNNQQTNQYQTSSSASPQTSQVETYTEKNCIADECLEVEGLEYPVGNLPENVKEALDEAINDEYKAEATYQKVIDKFGEVRPFIMIKRAETQHINSLKALYEKYGIEIPENDLASQVPTFDSITEACQAGVDAEIANVAIYDDLFTTVKDYEDITTVFEQLQSASENNHLPAFEKCSK